ncbi:MAG: alpha-L-fucosidase [Planctomycetes bacterium]|nr:alpha-L-fucosidase [Planctomycetota bacterium]
MHLPFRQIHLDFHTGPAIPDVGVEFDADEFARTLVEARVNSITVFGKCHHGHLYYDTKHPARHPGMKKGFDLLGEQLEALKRHNIRAPIYLSVQCDEYAGHTHPEWLVIPPGGGGNSLGAHWHIVDMSSPYQDFLADQINEVIKKFKPLDGVFLDMCWDQPSVSKWAVDGMLKAGLDPDNAEDRTDYSRRVSHQYMGRYLKQIESAHGGKRIAVAFNSRPLSNLDVEKKFLRHVEIEALPSGGWGYMYFPMNVRYVRRFGLPYMGMTARFHKGWADFGGLKPRAALMYECAQMLAQGAQCSVGDQLHPRGVLDRAAYELIGSVYKHVEACEPWCDGAKSKTQIGVLFVRDPAYIGKPGQPNEGVVRALQQLRHQFDFVDTDADLSPFELVIVPEGHAIDAPLKARLTKYLKSGGALLVCGPSAVGPDGKPAMRELGIVAHGQSPFSTTYLRFGREIGRGIPATDHVVYEPGLRFTPARGAQALARVVEPYFERNWRHFSSHNQTPPDKVSRYAAAVQKGRCITIAYPIFRAYASHGNLPLRELIGRCIDRLLPEPLVRAGGPSFLETSITTQGKRTITHLVAFAPQRRTQSLDIVEDATPLINVSLSVRLGRKPRRAYLAPENVDLDFEFHNGRAEVSVTHDRGHVMVVFE